MKSPIVSQCINICLLALCTVAATIVTTCPRSLVGQDSLARSESELTRLPFESPLNLIIVQARLNEIESVKLLIDTGSSTSLVLDNSVAEKMNLEMSTPVRGGKTSQGGKFTMQFVKRLSIDVGGHTIEIDKILIAPCLDQVRTILGIDVHGIIGHQFIKKFVLELDYEKDELALHDPKKYEYEGIGEILDIEFNPKVGNLPFITSSFESENGIRHDVKMLIDSGGSTSATAGLGLKKDIEAVVPNDSLRIKTKGVTGLADSSEETIHSSFLTRVYRMRLGQHVLNRPILSFGSTHKFNLFGSEVLRRFDVVFDYSRKRMILKPNESFGAALQTDKSGFMLIAEKDNVNTRFVQFVSPGSPAAEAGLKAGDTLLEIDGKAADAQGLIETRELFYQAGREFKLSVKRGTEVRSLNMTTRELF